MVLSKHHRLHLRAVHEAQERELRAGEELLHHHLAMAELVVKKHVFQCLVRLFQCLGHDHSLARSQAVILQHNRKFTGIDIGESLIVVRKSAVRSRRNIVFRHQLLRKILARFNAGSSPGRAENFQAASLELIYDTCRKRDLRSHYSQVNAFILSKFRKFIHLGILKRDTFCLTGYAGIAGSAEYLFHPL
ncbi:unknown [Bacteroides sp. CAG:545]|nr:unknown [Bacteroides sp. CAG:545]